MTNMTFTKGIMMSVNIVREVLNKEKYKEAADVFLFGVILYEWFRWGEVNPKALFKFPWQISTLSSPASRFRGPTGCRRSTLRWLTGDGAPPHRPAS